jgi:hypothetical protein
VKDKGKHEKTKAADQTKCVTAVPGTCQQAGNDYQKFQYDNVVHDIPPSFLLFTHLKVFTT